MAATPPAFNPSRQQSGNKVWVWLLVAVGGLCLLCIGGLFFGVKSLFNVGFKMASCMMDGELAKNAVLAYAKEHDGKLPSAETWQDDIRPNYERLYNKAIGEMDPNKMPSWVDIKIAKPGEVLECEMGSNGKTGFAFNDALGGKNISDFKDPFSTILIWETTSPAYNAHGNPDSRSATDPALKMFGHKRKWMDFPLEGEADPFKSGNTKMDIKITPEDGLPPAKGGGSTPPTDGKANGGA